ncbi:Kiwa anti-phage protein KwaB-like domain-containing protein [Xanthomonas oryzae]|uniref:Kiwa anti-phage protein KwaB-like domain-containing protein n=1 Tax=Xanthomonas oryzae TaxID=347 RepID=UPI0023D93090|nr:Kiwa anti-phage protein KwaB-like domain-containing protein [Xanthomonas oryzae]MDI9069953.1 DUF4868 domain-containing protein [Xanthomonas oryzae pv. oryzae]MDI9080370.1 DUF4868 domain-containing protein [Xanthomonas oryzae pv. oryzae]MDI9103190.1 DUF4868 domain-containing protein [Xanthomonas oryzae pv. oryzae]MDI9911920.1 DUF4868 domain-containing protein [Xanthomonas oryzae pv. oryzae]WEK99496.1 DUF4868 domain-containing protein [Xanthomonas oryzae pv. oryzae]
MTLLEDGIQALNSLVALMDEPDGQIGCHVFIHSKATRTRKTTWFKIAMERPLAEKIEEATTKAVRHLLLDAREGHLTEFDFDAMVDGEIGVISIQDVPDLGPWFASLPPDTSEERFDGDPELVERATHYARRLNFPNGKSLIAIAGKSAINLNAGEKGKIASIFSRQRDEMIEVDGPLITIKAKISFILWDDLVFIQELSTFETLTQVREATIKRATQAVANCKEIFELSGDTESVITRLSKKPALAKRLAAADKNGYMKGMTGEKLKARAIEKKLNLDFIHDPLTGKYELEIDESDAQQIEDLVDLLSEFFLRSPATDREFEARAKRPARPRRGAGRKTLDDGQ